MASSAQQRIAHDRRGHVRIARTERRRQVDADAHLATLQEADSGSVTLDGIDVLHQKDELRRCSAICRRSSVSIQKYPRSTLLDHFARAERRQRRADRARRWSKRCSVKPICGTPAISRSARFPAA